MTKPQSAKERGLLKGAIMRVFSRSELRRAALAAAITKHSDPKHPRVTKWGLCRLCLSPTPLYKMQVDHITPKIPVDRTLEQMTWDELIDNTWCDLTNLQPVCLPCHQAKTKEERKLRRKKK